MTRRSKVKHNLVVIGDTIMQPMRAIDRDGVHVG